MCLYIHDLIVVDNSLFYPFIDIFPINGAENW